VSAGGTGAGPGGDADADGAREEAPPRPRPLLHAGLFLATLLTTTATGALHEHDFEHIAPISDGLLYSVPLMLILLCHELGHYIVARRHGVPASLPYFIPLPPGLGFGTLGAVIGMRSSTTDRKQLIDVGAAGPLAGLAVAVPLLIYGLKLSTVGPLASGMQEGNSLLYALLKWLVKGAWLPDGVSDVRLHPIAFASWVGLLITMINLLPVGQLDGGHIASAYFGNGYNRFAEGLRKLLPIGAAAVFFWVLHAVKLEARSAWRLGPGALIALNAAVPWVMWFFLLGLMRRMTGGVNHPPVDDKPLPPSRRLLFWVMVVVFVAVLVPVPLRRIFVGEPAAPDSASISLGTVKGFPTPPAMVRGAQSAPAPHAISANLGP
jgi:membrane-associated protease RseP (regulator of RpoE activity)